jgi:hypothetical protein
VTTPSSLHAATTSAGDCPSFVDASTSSSSVASSSVAPLTTREIAQLRCLLVTWDSSPSGSAGSATDFSGTKRPPSHSGTSSWVLDTGASFHMTYDSFALSFVRLIKSPVSVLTADGLGIPVASRGTLSSSFHVPSAAHIP